MRKKRKDRRAKACKEPLTSKENTSKPSCFFQINELAIRPPKENVPLGSLLKLHGKKKTYTQSSKTKAPPSALIVMLHAEKNYHA